MLRRPTNALKVALAEFISMLISVFPGEGSGTAFSKSFSTISFIFVKWKNQDHFLFFFYFINFVINSLIMLLARIRYFLFYYQAHFPLGRYQWASCKQKLDRRQKFGKTRGFACLERRPKIKQLHPIVFLIFAG